MSSKPTYIVHEVDERDVTVDWFFGPGHATTKLGQLALLVVGWFFAVLPIVVTASALLHRYDDGGWWSYEEGFAMWDQAMFYLGILLIFFIVGFLALNLIHRATLKERSTRNTFDEARLVRRLDIADAWYADKFGPEALRRRQRRVEIQPYGDVETYELRGLYRSNGVS